MSLHKRHGGFGGKCQSEQKTEPWQVWTLGVSGGLVILNLGNF